MVCKNINCFTAYQCHGALTGNLKALMNMVEITNDKYKIGQYTGWASQFMRTIDNIHLPTDKKPKTV